MKPKQEKWEGTNFLQTGDWEIRYTGPNGEKQWKTWLKKQIDIARKEGYKKGYKDGKSLDSRINEAHGQLGNPPSQPKGMQCPGCGKWLYDNLWHLPCSEAI